MFSAPYTTTSTSFLASTLHLVHETFVNILKYIQGVSSQKPKLQAATATRRRLASAQRKLAAQRKSLHGHLLPEIVRSGKTIKTAQLSYKAWQKQ